LCEAGRGVLQNFTINAVDKLVIDFYALQGSKITNLRSIYHPERRDYDVAKMGLKTGAGKT
jgi:hypothetical protein